MLCQILNSNELFKSKTTTIANIQRISDFVWNYESSAIL